MILRAATCLFLIFLLSCSDQKHRAQPIGEAYVGPATLNLRQELTPKAAVSAIVKHGEKLDILETKRHFVKVRTEAGSEGWADNRQLLSPEQMAALRKLADNAAHDPSQGAATVFDPLNMHTDPNRTSPTFWQVPENASVDVIDHKLTPRAVAAQASAPAPVRKPKPVRRKPKSGASAKLAPPPPPAPKPPENWLELSVPKEEDVEPPPPVPAKGVPPPQMDDWSLVRTKEGKVGWVLTRALNMAIPDEVAQYAEGHRITSYFAIGETQDGDSVKKNWLWTTITKGGEPYEFDSFRVFVWSKKRHHYETAFIERKVVGHYPVHVDSSGANPTFSVVVESDGRWLRKTYTFAGYHVRLVSKEPYQVTVKLDSPQSAQTPAQKTQAPVSWYARMKDRVRRLFH